MEYTICDGAEHLPVFLLGTLIMQNLGSSFVWLLLLCFKAVLGQAGLRFTIAPRWPLAPASWVLGLQVRTTSPSSNFIQSISQDYFCRETYLGKMSIFPWIMHSLVNSLWRKMANFPSMEVFRHNANPLHTQHLPGLPCKDLEEQGTQDNEPNSQATAFATLKSVCDLPASISSSRLLYQSASRYSLGPSARASVLISWAEEGPCPAPSDPFFPVCVTICLLRLQLLAPKANFRTLDERHV